MNRNALVNATQTGAALLTALALLAVFALIGAACLQFVMDDVDRTSYELRSVYARTAAAGGVAAAIGEIERALQTGQLPQTQFEFEFPVYVKCNPSDRDVACLPIQYAAQDQENAPAEELLMTKFEGRIAVARVAITDEAAKVDLNHVPRAVLEALPGFDRPTARNVKAGLPRVTDAYPDNPGAKRRWLCSLDDLVVRGLMRPDAFEALDKQQLTVYSAHDLEKPDQIINVNSAPPEVLAAVLGVDLAIAQNIAEKRPFASLDELAAAAGKEPASFNIAAAPPSADQSPNLLALRSRCYRIQSEATYATLIEGEEYRPVTRMVEAVVAFDTQGRNPRIRFWRAGAVVVHRDTAAPGMEE